MVTRREMIGLLAGSMPALWAAGSLLSADGGGGRKRLGICTASYVNHWTAARSNHPAARFKDAAGFLEHCHAAGAGGMQAVLGTDPEAARRIRLRAEALGMYIEGQIRMPWQDSDVPRFEAELKTAREAGAAVVRAAMLSGRRYEDFASAEAFREFASRSWAALARSEPLLRKHGLRLALENHKDWRVPELLGMLERISSEHVGVCVDTGNSIALLEEPMAVIEAYAPWAAAVHLKDMAVREYEDGFLLAEVPLGEGFLDLRNVVEMLVRARPEIEFSLEMITRDALRIPCLTERYWATMGEVRGGELARMLALVRKEGEREPLPRVSELGVEKRLELEEGNVRRSVKYARGIGL